MFSTNRRANELTQRAIGQRRGWQVSGFSQLRAAAPGRHPMTFTRKGAWLNSAEVQHRQKSNQLLQSRTQLSQPAFQTKAKPSVLGNGVGSRGLPTISKCRDIESES